MIRAVAVGLLVLVFPFRGWGQESSLELMNQKERLDFVRTGGQLSSKVIFRDSAGTVLKNVNVKFPVINGKLLTGIDYYKNRSGKVVEVVLRQPGPDDYELNRRLFDAEEEIFRGSLIPAEVSCESPRQTLADLYAVESENRKDGKVVDAELDNVQEAKVIAFLQRCGAPVLQTAGGDGIRVVYDVLLHARRKNQEKYYHVLETFIKNGYIRKGFTAEIEDRQLMAQGKPQRYGTQILYFVKTGYHLYPVEMPDKLNVRRASAGLKPIEDYLREREDFYGAEIETQTLPASTPEHAGTYKD